MVPPLDREAIAKRMFEKDAKHARWRNVEPIDREDWYALADEAIRIATEYADARVAEVLREVSRINVALSVAENGGDP